MNREKKLFKNTFILSIGGITTKFITFFLLPLYTKVLSTEEYGIVDLFNTIISLLLPIVTLQVEQSVFRYLIDCRDSKKEKLEIISTGFFTVLLQCLIFIIIFIPISFFIKNEYKYFIMTNVISYIFVSLFQQIVRGLGDNKKYAISGIISASFTILFNLLFLLKLNLGGKGMLLGTLCGQIICMIYILLFGKIYNYINIKKFDKKVLKKLYSYSLPLIPNYISWWIFISSDRIIVSSILGLSMNGILSASHKFSNFFTNVYNIFQLGWDESISVHINDNDIDKYFNKMFNIVLYFFSSIIISIIAVMPLVYPILIDSKFGSGINLVPITLIGNILSIIVALETAIYIGKKNTKIIANTAIVSSLINIVVHLALIKYIGIYASVISTVISYLFLGIYRYFDIKKKYFKITFDKLKTLFTLLILIITLFIYYQNDIILTVINIIIVIVYDILLNKKELGSIVGILKHKKSKTNAK